ncbi:Golgi SNAP receptor complex member 1 [Chironomus tepperi]|uniref:Golgi SNAP receptor complex member 1 n=1 Tax=Chironomus tepperi TaxID=113505 RepID=UPI00391F6D19
MSESWDDLRKKSRNLENEIDLKLVSLSKICSGSGHSGGESSPLISSEFTYDTISVEINDMLAKLSDYNDKMTQIKPTGNAMMHTQSRHRDILNAYRTEFNKITQNHNIKLEREELLRGSGLLSSNSSNSLSRRDMYLKESQHLSNSHSMVNDQINIAIETQKSLKTQRKAFKKIQNRFNNLANAFPRINSLVQRINIKKRRDSLILGLVIAVCTLLMLLYAFH